MKRSLFFLLPLVLCAALRLPAQNTIFLTEGKIEFEKKINLYDQMQEENETWSDLMKKAIPKFRTDYFELLFTKNKTLYQPGRPNPDNNKIQFDEQPAQDNRVYSDLEHEKSISQKKVFEQVFLVQDSTRKIQWKITDETRTIAGFTCRRANAIIMDSVYVVAFYTDEITSTGGPESFSGLPGMILGVAVPHQHITWFATKVEATPVAETEFKIPSKGKKTTGKELKATLGERMKEWGKQGKRILLVSMI
ncbi:MAG TPA: GLPGLI family protein [Chitinophagaceae bacterium]